MAWSHAEDDYDEDDLDDDDAPEFAEGHLGDKLAQPRVNLTQTHARMVNLVWYLVDHFGLLLDFYAKVLILILKVLNNRHNLVKVALLVINLLPLQLDQLMAWLTL